jgi:hypothetical protein
MNPHNRMIKVILTKVILAYFLEYAIVRTLSVREPFYSPWVDRLGRFMGQLITYGVWTLAKEGIFLDRSWA